MALSRTSIADGKNTKKGNGQRGETRVEMKERDA